MSITKTLEKTKPLVSWLGSVYRNSKLSEVEGCLSSILNQDTNFSQEIILVIDGPISLSLSEFLVCFQSSSTIPLTIKTISTNVGLAEALNFGLLHCNAPYIARFDTDDLSDSLRITTQLNYLLQDQSISVLGSSCYEFVSSRSSESLASIRLAYPTPKLSFFLNVLNPIFHPTVVCKTSDLKFVGGYPNVRYFEDYALWLSMRSAGFQFATIKQPLVYMRCDNILDRRTSFAYARYELSFLRWAIFDRQLINPLFLPFWILKIFSRIIPFKGLQKLVRRRSSRSLITNPDMLV